VTIFSDGHIGDAAVVKPAQFGLTASTIEQILAKWHFKPALDDQGKATTMRPQVEVNYYDK
jgi:TonB-like protein